MARIEDIAEPMRSVIVGAPCPTYETRPFVTGGPLAERRIAVVSSAALSPRG